MRKWALLVAAIVVEVAATLSLRASQDDSAWLIVVVAGYTGAFVLLTLVLRAGLSIGVAYGIWGALGTVGTAVLAAVIFGDPFTAPIAGGIGLIIAGVLLVELGSRHSDKASAVMWVALAGAILFEVLGNAGAARVGGLPQQGLDRSGYGRLPRVVLPAVADACAGHARRHRLRRVDRVRGGASSRWPHGSCSTNR